MSTREMLIDVMSDIDPAFIGEHMARSNGTTSRRVARYAVPVAIYAAACVVVMLILPHVIRHGNDPAPTPGDNPIIAETVVTGSDTETETQVPDEPELPTGITEFNGCEYTITLDKPYYTVNDTINATVVLENKGYETIGLYQGYLGCFLDEVVFYENGEERRSFSSDYGKGYNYAILVGFLIPEEKIVFNVQFTPGAPLDQSFPADPASDWTVTAYLSYYPDPDTTEEDTEPDYDNMKTASVSVEVPHDRETPSTVEVTTEIPETTVTTPEVTAPPPETTTTTAPPPEATTTTAPPAVETEVTTVAEETTSVGPETEPVAEPKGMVHITDGEIPYSLITYEHDLCFAIYGNDKCVEPNSVYTSAEEFKNFTDECREAINNQTWLTSLLDSWEYFNEDFFEKYNLYFIRDSFSSGSYYETVDSVTLDKDGTLVINLNYYEYTGGVTGDIGFASFVIAVDKDYAGNGNRKTNTIKYLGFHNYYTRKVDYVLESEVNNKNQSENVRVCPKCGINTLPQNIWVNAIDSGYVKKGYVTLHLKNSFLNKNYNKIYVESDDIGKAVMEMCFPDLEVEGVTGERISDWMVEDVLNGTYRFLYPISFLLSDTSPENIKATLESLGCWYCSDFEAIETPY